jgi:hypothetical protein
MGVGGIHLPKLGTHPLLLHAELGPEMRKVLDAGEENLRTLMTQLEQEVNVHGVRPTPDKKDSEPARVERMSGTDRGAGRATRWP